MRSPSRPSWPPRASAPWPGRGGGGRTGPRVVAAPLADGVGPLAGAGPAWGPAARSARQPGPLGGGEAVGRAPPAGAPPPLLVTAADTVYRAGDLAAASERF